MEAMEPRTPETVKVIQVIFTETVIGKGLSNDDPCRKVQQYWSLDGNLIVTKDSLVESIQHPR
jgi:hypothetical protein